MIQLSTVHMHLVASGSVESTGQFYCLACENALSYLCISRVKYLGHFLHCIVISEKRASRRTDGWTMSYSSPSMELGGGMWPKRTISLRPRLPPAPAHAHDLILFTFFGAMCVVLSNFTYFTCLIIYR